MEILGYDIPIWTVLGSLLLYLFYKWSTSTFDTFEKLNIPGPKPWPLFGNALQTFIKGTRVDQWLLFEKYGRSHPKIAGIYAGREPIMITFDVDMCKQILIKEFNMFRNRFGPGVNPPPVSKMLFSMVDETWTHSRNLLSPTFSSVKLRKMVDVINRSGRQLTENMENIAKTGETFDCQRYAKSFTMDTIASTLMSLSINSLKEGDNEFAAYANKMTHVSLFSIGLSILFICPGLAPLMDRVGMSIFPRDLSKFYKELVLKSIKDRQENPDMAPNDFLQSMLNARTDDDVIRGEAKVESDPDVQVNGKAPTSGRNRMTPDEIVYTSMVFMFAGFDTVGNPISMIMYELACNQDCQEKAYQEIQTVLSDGRDPTYDDIKEMKYISMCMQEAVRMFPGTVRLMRKAKDDIVINGQLIPKGMSVFIPIYSLQNDPDIWPDPEKFDPERFSPEMSAGREPLQWMPFGAGPRGCIAQRLGMLEIKIAIVHLIRKYRVYPSERTPIPIKMQRLRQEIKGGNWLKIEARN